MNPGVRKGIIALAVVLVPLGVFHSTRIATALMNTIVVPFGFARHSNIAYGEQSSHRLDVYVPKGASRSPVVIFWHGGMWMRGNKDEVRFVGAALARSGYVAVLPNYRLYPQVRYPDFVNDGARAVAWVRKEISSFNGDADEIFLMGHSAGAYIATMLAFDDHFLREQGTSARCLRGVIGMAGPYTLERPSIFVNSIFGKSSGKAWRPVDVVSTDAPPTLLLHGRADNIVSVGESEALAERLAAHFVPTNLQTYTDGTHQDLLIAWWRPLQFRAPVRLDVQRFIDRETGDQSLRPACIS